MPFTQFYSRYRVYDWLGLPMALWHRDIGNAPLCVHIVSGYFLAVCALVNCPHKYTLNLMEQRHSSTRQHKHRRLHVFNYDYCHYYFYCYEYNHTSYSFTVETSNVVGHELECMRCRGTTIVDVFARMQVAGPKNPRSSAIFQ